MESNFTNNGVDILIEISNFFENMRGELYMGHSVCYADFTITFERSCGETYELYLQPSFDGDGVICGLDGSDAQDDYHLLPKFIDENELIDDMNEVLREHESKYNMEPFEVAVERMSKY